MWTLVCAVAPPAVGAGMEESGVITAPFLRICTVKFGSRFSDPKFCAHRGVVNDIDANTNPTGAKTLSDLADAFMCGNLLGEAEQDRAPLPWDRSATAPARRKT